jgi:hypothetical protein
MVAANDFTHAATCSIRCFEVVVLRYAIVVVHDHLRHSQLGWCSLVISDSARQANALDRRVGLGVTYALTVGLDAIEDAFREAQDANHIAAVPVGVSDNCATRAAIC